MSRFGRAQRAQFRANGRNYVQTGANQKSVLFGIFKFFFFHHLTGPVAVELQLIGF